MGARCLPERWLQPACRVPRDVPSARRLTSGSLQFPPLSLARLVAVETAHVGCWPGCCVIVGGLKNHLSSHLSVGVSPRTWRGWVRVMAAAATGPCNLARVAIKLVTRRVCRSGSAPPLAPRSRNLQQPGSRGLHIEGEGYGTPRGVQRWSLPSHASMIVSSMAIPTCRANVSLRTATTSPTARADTGTPVP